MKKVPLKPLVPSVRRLLAPVRTVTLVVHARCGLITLSLCPRSALQVFHDVAYKARNREDLLAGVDEFLDKVTVLPPGEWDPKIRLEPPPQVGRGD